MTPSLVWIYLVILVVALFGAGFILYRRWQSRRALVARLDELSKFADAGQRILNAPFDLHQLAQRIYKEAGEIVDVSIFQLGLFDGDRYRLLIWIMDGEARPLREFSLTPNSLGIVGWMRESRRSLLVRDFEKEIDSLPAKPRYISDDPPRSAAFVPLMVGDAVLGVMAIQNRQPDAFSEEDLRLLSIIANHAAAALQNARLLDQAQRRATQLELLSEVAQQINALQSLPALYSQIVNLIAEKFSEYHVSFFEIEGEQLNLRATTNPDHIGKTITIRVGEDIAGEAAATGEPIIKQELPEYMQTEEPTHPHSTLVVPVSIGKRVLGVLEIRSHALFDQSVVSVFRSLAAQIAIAILEAQNYASLQEEAWSNAALLQVAEAVAASPSLDVSLQTVSRLTTMLVGVDRVAIYQRNDADSNFHLTHHEGLGDAASTLQRSPLSPSDLGVNETHVAAAALHTTLPPDLASAFECDQGMVWSLWARGELLGALVVEQRDALGKRLQILDGIAHQLSMAMENARLAREVAVQQRMEREMEVGRDIQASFLPDACPLIEGWSVCSYWQVARQVGGDFYDFIQLRPDDDGNERWGIVIADVADKGVPAALFMALSRTLLRSVAINRVSPADTLERVNQFILNDARSNLFVTVFYAVWTPRTGHFVYANGGHNPPLLIRAHGDSSSLTRTGAALGVFEEAQYEEHEITLHKGDSVLLYTDGLTDAINAQNEDFGLQRVTNIAAKVHTQPAANIQSAIVAAVATHVGGTEAFDDITMVVVKRDA